MRVTLWEYAKSVCVCVAHQQQQQQQKKECVLRDHFEDMCSCSQQTKDRCWQQNCPVHFSCYYLVSAVPTSAHQEHFRATLANLSLPGRRPPFDWPDAGAARREWRSEPGPGLALFRYSPPEERFPVSGWEVQPHCGGRRRCWRSCTPAPCPDQCPDRALEWCWSK